MQRPAASRPATRCSGVARRHRALQRAADLLEGDDAAQHALGVDGHQRAEASQRLGGQQRLERRVRVRRASRRRRGPSRERDRAAPRRRCARRPRPAAGARCRRSGRRRRPPGTTPSGSAGRTRPGPGAALISAGTATGSRVHDVLHRHALDASGKTVWATAPRAAWPRNRPSTMNQRPPPRPPLTSWKMPQADQDVGEDLAQRRGEAGGAGAVAGHPPGDRAGDPAAVERERRDEVEHEQEEVDRRQPADEQRGAG